MRSKSSASVARNRLQQVLRQPDFILQMKRLQQDLADTMSEFIEKYNYGGTVSPQQQSPASIAKTRLKQVVIDQRNHPDFLQQLKGKLNTVIRKYITTDQEVFGD